jgi:hypothetical protein
MQVYRGVEVQLPSFLTYCYIEVSGQAYAPATLPPGKQPLIPTEYEAKCAPETAWMLWKREKSLAPAIKPQTGQPV